MGFGMGLWRGIEAEQTYALLSHSDDPGMRFDRIGVSNSIAVA